MNKHDLENAFPKPTKEFHDKLVSTLNGLEREKKMKRLSVKKGILIAAAAVLVIGTAAFASSGAVKSITGSSSSIPDYRSLPDRKTLEDKMGFAPKLLESFSNGYTFKNGSDINNKVLDEEEGVLSRFKSVDLRYAKGEDEIDLHADTDDAAHEAPTDEPAEIYNGIEIYYSSFENRFVPADYELTEQDLIDQENGVVFSYGTDDIEIYQVQGVSWKQDGIYYHFNAMNSSIDKDGLISMAKEIIDF